MLARTVTLLIALLFGAGAYAQVAPVSRPSLITPAQTITAGNGMVVAQEQRAARIGMIFSIAAAMRSTPRSRSALRLP